jgi:autotransporter-associated beta strand protein
VRYTGAISGSGGLTKTGAGTLVLAANNASFAGALNAASGELELAASSGSVAGSVAAISVAANAVLLISQSDQVSDTAAVSLSGGTIQRGAGVNEVFGNLNITTGSFLDFGTGAAGNLTFGTYQNNETPSALLTLNNFLPGNSFTFTSTSFTTNDIGSYLAFGTGYAGSSITNIDSTFTITAIPEPSTYLAMAGLLALLVWGAFPRRNRRSSTDANLCDKQT